MELTSISLSQELHQPSNIWGNWGISSITQEFKNWLTGRSGGRDLMLLGTFASESFTTGSLNLPSSCRNGQLLSNNNRMVNFLLQKSLALVLETHTHQGWVKLPAVLVTLALYLHNAPKCEVTDYTFSTMARALLTIPNDLEFLFSWSPWEAQKARRLFMVSPQPGLHKSPALRFS